MSTALPRQETRSNFLHSENTINPYLAERHNATPFFWLGDPSNEPISERPYFVTVNHDVPKMHKKASKNWAYSLEKQIIKNVLMAKAIIEQTILEPEGSVLP